MRVPRSSEGSGLLLNMHAGEGFCGIPRVRGDGTECGQEGRRRTSELLGSWRLWRGEERGGAVQVVRTARSVAQEDWRDSCGGLIVHIVCACPKEATA